MPETTVKFQRNYSLSIEERGRQNTITIPGAGQPMLTIDFDIRRGVFAEANTAKLTIYNLGPDTRARLYHDRYRISSTTFQKIQMFAGYNTSKTQTMIFLGNLIEAKSYKTRTDWVTEISGFDCGLGLLKGNISLTVDKWTVESIAKTLTQKMQFVAFGAVGNIKTKSSRRISMVGSAFEIMQRLCGDGLVYADNGVLYAIREDEYIKKPGQVDLVCGPNNILGTPVRGEGLLDVKIVFEPSAFVGQAIQLQSKEAVYNGEYVVRGIRHQGTISDSVCGTATTTLTLWAAKELKPVLSNL